MADFDNFMANDALLPSQLSKGHPDEPYTNLWLSVMDMFLGDWNRAWSVSTLSLHHGMKLETMRHRLTEWLMDDGRHLGSFRFCCDALGIEQEVLRKRLLAIKAGDRMKLPRRMTQRAGKMVERVTRYSNLRGR